MHRHTMVIPSLYQCLKTVSYLQVSIPDLKMAVGIHLVIPFYLVHMQHYIISQALVLCPGESKLLLENTNPNFDYFGHHNLALILRIQQNPLSPR